MLDVSSLLCGKPQEGDRLRYGRGSGPHADTEFGHGSRRKPVVVFNITRDCNLRCIHCYSGSDRTRFPGQLSTPRIKEVLEDLAGFDVPAVLLSGGEPMVHPDFFDILEFAAERGLRVTLSTNGTLIDDDKARRLKASGVTYVGISLDGMAAVNDRMRGAEGAFRRARRGIRSCRRADQKVGLRLTLTRYNYRQLDEVFEFLVEEDLQRVCFYHLAWAGRGRDIPEADLTHEERRRALEVIFRRTRELHRAGRDIEVLTVANPVDNVFLLNTLQREAPGRIPEAVRSLRWNGGALNASARALASIDFYGRVHPNQFWMTRTLGNVKERPFSSIWTDPDNGFLRALRNRSRFLEDPCASCPCLEICGGGLRLRAEAGGDLWGQDPSCYVTDAEREAAGELLSG